jgi:hypothetical protein
MARASERTHWWQHTGNLSQVLSAIGAIGALIFIAYQVSEFEANNRKANARQVYLAYAEAGLRYPEFLRPANYAAIKRDPVKFEQYKAYVAQMIFAYDEMITVTAGHSWVDSFEYELPDHLALLCDLKKTEPRFFTQFEVETNVLIEQALAGKCPTTLGAAPAPDTNAVPERAQQTQPERPQPERTEPERTQPERAQAERAQTERAQAERIQPERRNRIRR